MTSGVWTIPSLLSMSRIPIAGVVAYFILSDDPSARLWGSIAILIGVATDFLDGYLARRLHTVSEFGKVIDPVADKIGIAIAFLALTIAGDLEVWIVSVIVCRDLLLLAGAIYIRRQKRITVQSNWPGKVAVTSMAVLVLVSFLRMDELSLLRELTLWFTMAMVGLSLGIYVKRLFIGLPKHGI